MRVPTDRFRPGRRPFDPLILAAAGVLVLLTGAFAVHGYTTWRGIQRDAANEVRILNQLAAQATEALFEQIAGNVRVIGDRLLELEQRNDRDGIAALMQDFAKATPGFVRIVVITAAGEQLFLSAPLGQRPAAGPLKEPSVRPTYDEAARQRNLFLGRTFLNPFGQWVIPLRYPVRDAAGRLRLFVAGGMSVEPGDYFLARVELPAGFGLRLVRTDGYLQLAHPLPAQLREPLYTRPVPDYIRGQIAGMEPGASGSFADDVGFDGEQRYGAFQRLRDFELVLVVSAPRARLRAAWLQQMALSAGLYAVFLLGGMLVLWLALRAERRATREREEVHEQLRRSEALARVALESAQMDIWSRSVGGSAIEFVGKIAERFGLPTEKVPKTAAEFLALVHPQDRDRIRDAMLQGDREGTPLEQEFRLVLPDGSVRWLEIHGRTFAGSGDEARRVGTVRDISERKRAEEQIRQLNEELEERVADRTAALERANQALESFGHSVAHDLKAPLRAIGGFATMLRDGHTARLDPAGLDLVARILATTAKSDQMVEGLLRLSQLSGQPMRRERVDLSSLAEEVIARLRGQDPQRTVETKVAPGLAAEGDRALLETLLENLMSNGWKFTRSVARPEIEFGARRAPDGGTQYFVRDNGVGFDMRFAAKIFGVFQRMHSQNEFPGTGVGLSIVQRIVERHQGRVWAEAQPGAGATFYFTLWDPGPEGAR